MKNEIEMRFGGFIPECHSKTKHYSICEVWYCRNLRRYQQEAYNREIEERQRLCVATAGFPSQSLRKTAMVAVQCLSTLSILDSPIATVNIYIVSIFLSSSNFSYKVFDFCWCVWQFSSRRSFWSNLHPSMTLPMWHFYGAMTLWTTPSFGPTVWWRQDPPSDEFVWLLGAVFWWARSIFWLGRDGFSDGMLLI